MGLFDFLKKTKIATTEKNLPINYENDDLPVVWTRTEQNVLDSMGRLGELGSKLSDVYIESKRINANIKALRIQTNAVVQMHANSIIASREIVTKVFAERSLSLNKHYEVLDKALKSNDRDLIIASLQGISSIVVANPIEQIGEYLRMLQDSGTRLKLDF